MKKISSETKKKIGMAAAVAATLFVGVLVFYKHWQFELPGYPNVDEQLSLDCIYNLLNQHIYAGDIYVLEFFRYPHLTFYYALVGVRILGKILSGFDMDTLIRFVVCGTAMLSNVCVYFTVKKLTGSRKWAYIGLVLSVFSLYSFSYLYYTGPDTMLYAVANVIVLLGTILYLDKEEERSVYLWYPLLAICIGLAMAAKYHGILFGLFWLVLHIIKRYWKSYRNNFVFFINCIVLALVFCICDYSMFFHFPNFIGDNLYNLQHYAWGHPGIEHNLPLLGHLEAYSLTSYGVVGGIFLLLGIVALFRRKEFKQLIVYLIMPVFVIVFLSKYTIMLGRNLALVIPFSYIFFVYGLMETEQLINKLSEKLLSKKKEWEKRTLYIVPAIVALMVLCNIFAAVNTYHYELTYTKAVAWIEENIPAGATLYCTSFAPNLDAEKYKIVDIGEDVSKLPDTLGEKEYYIDVEYATGYFHQKKDYLITKSGDMYPELKGAYEEKTSGFTLEQAFPGITYGGEWKFRVGYLDRFRYSKEEFYVGPTISVFH
ncbi:MAG: glycosyltransferase family 39 protein [Lachnospiraceae bacterium]|nr:glycosyltransferase family 39 protein [Lachnospiraceae bacterium]MDD6810673.1 glycosyltransferase family 39 protein [Lachnospiraceae bacterium]